MKNLLKRTACMLGLAAALVAAAPASAQAPKKVVVSQLFQSVMFLPLYVALDHGFFAQQGLDVTKQTSGSPNASLSAVIAGSAEFSLHGPEWTAIAASKGADVQVIAGVVNRAAVWIAAAPDLKYAGPKDFAGQTVSTGMMPIASTSLFSKLLRDNKIDPAAAGITVKQVQAGAELGPLLAGQASVGVFYQPALEQAVAKGFKVVHSFPRQYGPYLLSAITARKSVDADTARRFIAAMESALRFMNTHPAEAVAIARTEFPSIDPAVVEAAVKRMLAEQVYATTVAISPDALRIAMDTQIALGNLKSQPDYDTLVARKLIEGGIARVDAAR
ncbi:MULTISPECIES: ABC transporter substrate-binding protein [Cupriavidus]|uniref:ABC transporter substrate-binding protein n=1 Tax=Cupriavidus sp. WS TaxID=1312922 RepID=UPI00048D3546|nr:ABC transporter substrate-binding protein [Cupriavidus sp. WS]